MQRCVRRCVGSLPLRRGVGAPLLAAPAAAAESRVAWVPQGARALSSTPALQQKGEAEKSLADAKVEDEFLECVEHIYEDQDSARTVFRKLSPAARAEVLNLMEVQLELGRNAPAKPPTSRQLLRLAFLAGLPMIGFGFMDNAIMIVAGDYIDAQLCFHLGLSTLFAAALGNIASDVAGVATAGPIETLMRNLGVRGHGLTPGQMRHPAVLSFKYLGTAIGVTVGCIIGMFPLIWPKEYRLWPTRAEIEADEAAEP